MAAAREVHNGSQTPASGSPLHQTPGQTRDPGVQPSAKANRTESKSRRDRRRGRESKNCQTNPRRARCQNETKKGIAAEPMRMTAAVAHRYFRKNQPCGRKSVLRGCRCGSVSFPVLDNHRHAPVRRGFRIIRRPQLLVRKPSHLRDLVRPQPRGLHQPSRRIRSIGRQLPVGIRRNARVWPRVSVPLDGHLVGQASELPCHRRQQGRARLRRGGVPFSKKKPLSVSSSSIAALRSSPSC